MVTEQAASPKQLPPALRVVHLLGGLRAFDFGDDTVSVGVDGLTKPMNFTRPAYGKLYIVLEELGFQPIGVQFITSPDDLNGFDAPQWHAWRSPVGFGVKGIGQEWSNVRSQKLREGATDIAYIASKIATYLKLLNLRLYHLSVGYHHMLRAQLRRKGGDPPTTATRFANIWGDSVDAAIHAFLADAASLRDTLAEAVWRLVLKKTDHEVLSIAGLIKRAKSEPHPLVVDILKETEDGGWIKNLSDLRNEIMHVVPVGDIHEHSYLDLRELSHNGGGHLFYLHYPFTTPDWGLRRDIARTVDYSDGETVRRSIEVYDGFAKTSGDALEYAWRTLANLAGLSDQVRRAAGLKASIPVITEADIVPGSLRVRTRD